MQSQNCIWLRSPRGAFIDSVSDSKTATIALFVLTGVRDAPDTHTDKQAATEHANTVRFVLFPPTHEVNSKGKNWKVGGLRPLPASSSKSERPAPPRASLIHERSK